MRVGGPSRRPRRARLGLPAADPRRDAGRRRRPRDADLDRARPVANATRRSFSRWMLMVAEAGHAAFAGRLDEADRMTEEALALNRRHSDDCFHEHTVGRLVLARLRWRPQDADAAQLRGFAARYPHLPAWEAMLASLEWELGNVEAARRGVALCARDDFAAVRARPTSWPRPCAWPRPPPGAGEPGQVERLYELLAPYADANPVLEHAVGDLGAGGARARAAGRRRRPPAGRRRALRRRAAAGGGVGRARAGSCARSATGWRPACRSATARSSSAAACCSRASSRCRASRRGSPTRLRPSRRSSR